MTPAELEELEQDPGRWDRDEQYFTVTAEQFRELIAAYKERDELREILGLVRVEQNSDACNACLRRFGFRDTNYHCALCGQCLINTDDTCTDCRLAKALGK